MTFSEGIDKAGDGLGFVWDVLKMTWKIVSNRYVLVAAFTTGVICLINVFFTLYELRSPVLVSIQTPYVARQVEYIEPVVVQAEAKVEEDTNVLGASTEEIVEVEPLTTKEQIIENMIHYIEGKESSHGKNTNPNALHNVCRAKGMSNNLGFGGMANMWCYNNEADAEAVVRRWLNEYWSKTDGDVKMMLCYYNQGIMTRDCTYAQEF